MTNNSTNVVLLSRQCSEAALKQLFTRLDFSNSGFFFRFDNMAQEEQLDNRGPQSQKLTRSH